MYLTNIQHMYLTFNIYDLSEINMLTERIYSFIEPLYKSLIHLNIYHINYINLLFLNFPM